jgi:hypothetical protein
LLNNNRKPLKPKEGRELIADMPPCGASLIVFDPGALLYSFFGVVVVDVNDDRKTH